MTTDSAKPTTINEYIAGYPPDVQNVLNNILRTIREAAPDAEEKISYQMPAFTLHGPLVYFGAFKEHIGFYPPIQDEALKQETAVYANEKGNLRFPLDQPIPYPLITRLVQARVRENAAAQDAKRAKALEKSAGKRR